MIEVPNPRSQSVMEASSFEEEEGNSKAGVFDRILPPRLEDAGLEDCALPPDSIAEAFFKAASAVTSARIYSDDDGEDSEKELKVPEFGMGERGGKGCVVDVLEGLEIEDEAATKKKKSGAEEKPILAEGSA